VDRQAISSKLLAPEIILFHSKSVNYKYFDRDLSWLSFNERILSEASKASVPLRERINFLSIFSSNLDEFYRVRIPALIAFSKIKGEKSNAVTILEQATVRIKKQQELFGLLLNKEIIPCLREEKVYLLYNEPLLPELQASAHEFFFSQLLTFIQIIGSTEDDSGFFPESNKLYMAALLEGDDGERTVIINIPSDHISRFFMTTVNDRNYVVFIDDIIKENLPLIFSDTTIKGAYNFKITRDSELNLKDEYRGDIAEKIEKLITKRDMGFATRFLYAPDTPLHLLQQFIKRFNLTHASVMKGGIYHNLKDLSSLPIAKSTLFYPEWLPIKKVFVSTHSIFDCIAAGDVILHTPYHDYNPVLRFFNEAATNTEVEEIYVTTYRIASDSRIAAALISAAKNGKQVTVFVELKARFDEANNIRWAKKMKESGVKIIYSIPGLKVHAKVALVKKKKGDRTRYYGLLATGNFNENTARFYTDHILFTAHKEILRELELLFIYLAKRKKPDPTEIKFNNLLVAQFNLQEKFLKLLQREIDHAKQGLPAAVIIKLNNLEEEMLINKLYEASQAGVKIQLLVRSICRLIPGIESMSANISVKRIVDRFLEHGRLFWFHNNGQDELYAGSADWMNRNIYQRIEVCFPIYDEVLKNELKKMLLLQTEDNVQAVELDEQLNNVTIQPSSNNKTRSQEAIYELVKNHE
jgi:polyphosphate kinase